MGIDRQDRGPALQICSGLPEADGTVVSIFDKDRLVVSPWQIWHLASAWILAKAASSAIQLRMKAWTEVGFSLTVTRILSRNKQIPSQMSPVVKVTT